MICSVDNDFKKNYMDLLLIADPDVGMIEKYLEECKMYVLLDGSTVLSIACVLDLGGGTVELKNLVTNPEHERMGNASKLIHELLDIYSAEADEMIVGTGDDLMEFYSRFGFEYYRTEKGFFSRYPEPVYDNGKLLEDMQYLKRKLR